MTIHGGRHLDRGAAYLIVSCSTLALRLSNANCEPSDLSLGVKQSIPSARYRLHGYDADGAVYRRGFSRTKIAGMDIVVVKDMWDSGRPNEENGVFE